MWPIPTSTTLTGHTNAIVGTQGQNMRKLLIALSLLLSIPFVSPTTNAHAAAAPYPFCETGATLQNDMAGVYVNSSMRLTLYPCGGSYMVWQNAYGTHESGYVSYARLPGGGVIATGFAPDPVSGGYLDSVRTIAYKPAEPGYIEVATINALYDVVYVYRLRKVS